MTESPVLVWTAPIGLLVAVLVGCSGTPAASLASTTIIFHDRDWLWRTEPDGRNLVQITDFGWLAEYSPESSRIAFGGCYESGIWVANADGKDPVRLTDFGSSPSRSPDGSKLAFHAGVLADAMRVFDVCVFSPPESYQWVAMALSDGGHSLRHIFARLSSRVGGPGIGLAAATILSVRWSTPVIHLRRNKRYHLCRAWPAARPPPDSLPHGLGVTRAIGGAEPIRDRRLPSIYSLPQQR